MSKKHTPIHICKTCGKRFEKNKNTSKARWLVSFFCSRSCVNINRTPFNKGKKMIDVAPNFIHGMLGKHHSENAIQKIKHKRAKQKITTVQREELRKGAQILQKKWEAQRVIKLCLVCKKEMRLSPSTISRKYCSLICYGKAQTKGDRPSYSAIHNWVHKYLVKRYVCDHCGNTFESKYIDWANKSQLYKKEASDWLRLCKKCHRKFDSQFQI